MADFRKWFYALAVVTLLSGLTVPTYAQGIQPFICQANAGTPPVVRAESYDDLVGDFVLACTGGVPTPAGAVVPAANVTVFLSTNITSRLLNTSLGFNEALLIVDEPNSALRPGRPILNCGNVGAPDSGPSGPGVCAIVSTGDPAMTYDGTPNVSYTPTTDQTPGGPITCTTDAYGCGRPNVFQGRLAIAQNVGQANSIVFEGVPLDPPGPNNTRVLRITNVRADAELFGISSTFTVQQINMIVSISNNASLSINNPQQIVAVVQRGLQDIDVQGRFDYIQCISEFLSNSNLNQMGQGNSAPNVLGATTKMKITYKEGFADSWKTKGWEQIQANGEFTGFAWRYDMASLSDGGTSVRQNVPGAIYHTEGGFSSRSTQVLPSEGPPVQNPPIGVGTVPVSGGGVLAHRLTGANDTGIANAGIATQGTRLVLSLQNIPAGSSVSVPEIAYLVRTGTKNITGVAVLITGHDGQGAGGGLISTPAKDTWTAVGSDNLAIYEVIFSDAFALEDMIVPIGVSYTKNLASNRPDPTVTAQAAGGFAPFYDRGAGPRAPQPDSAYPTPRFVPGQDPQDLYRVNKCACNLLFPFVTNAAAGDTAFDTGIALANTSRDPGGAFGFTAAAQEGTVQFWYYNSASGTTVATQCTNLASPGDCPGTTVVPAGGLLTYVLSQGSTDFGLDNRAAGFSGYMIAQAQFQYCHAFAYISAQGAGPLTPGMSTGYLALVLDKGSELQRTVQTLSDTLGH